MKNLVWPKLVFLFLMLASKSMAQTDSVSAKSGIKKFQEELDQEYRDPARSPLKDKASSFEGHQFFPIDLKYKVVAKLTLSNNSPFLIKKTTGPRMNEER